jgi:hypothetical protein
MSWYPDGPLCACCVAPKPNFTKANMLHLQTNFRPLTAGFIKRVLRATRMGRKVILTSTVCGLGATWGCGSPTSTATTGTVIARVRDVGGVPLQAQVDFALEAGRRESKTSGADGRAQVDGAPVGNVTVTASAAGYEAQTRIASVVAKEVTQIDVSPLCQDSCRIAGVVASAI